MTQAMLLFGEGVRQRQKREGAVGECGTHREVALITRSTFFSSATTASAAATTTGGCRAIRASLT